MIQIAIDGPAGAGKSTIAKLLAKKLNYTYIDTGAMFRAVANVCLQQGLDVKDNKALDALLDNLIIEFGETTIDGVQAVFCNGKNVTEIIRTPEVSGYVSTVAAIPAVRAHLLDAQRAIADYENVIMDGRDIGTVVLPKADYKFFLTASLEARTERRRKELEGKGFTVDHEQLSREIAERDRKDEERECAPLKPAETAIFVDTSGMTIQEVVDKLFHTMEK